MRRAAHRLIAGAISLALAACSSPTASVGPSTPASMAPVASGSESALPSSSTGTPSEAPASTEPSSSAPPTAFQVLPPGAALKVTVRELNLRRQPSTSARRVTSLAKGDLLVVSPGDALSFGWGPVEADGYQWYPVVRPNTDPDGTLPALPTGPLDFGGAEPVWGWVAADDGVDQYVGTLQPRCPTTVDLSNVSGMLPAERLACFGGPIVLEGTYGCSGCGGASAGEYRPAWLASPLAFEYLSVDPSAELGPLTIRFPPDGPPLPTAGSIIRVTVHVDDRRSSRCTVTEPDDDGVMRAAPAESVVFVCREQLVVDSYEVLGTDPRFPEA